MQIGLKDAIKSSSSYGVEVQLYLFFKAPVLAGTSVPVLYPLQLDVPAKNRVDDVVEHVRVLHLGLHDDLLSLRTLRLDVVLPEIPLLLSGLACRAPGGIIVLVRLICNNVGHGVC